MYSTGRVSLDTQQGKEGEREQISVSRPVLPTQVTASALQLHSLPPSGINLKVLVA